MKRYEDVGVRRKLIKELISLDYEALKEESRKYL